MAQEFDMSIKLQHVRCSKCHIDFALRKAALLKLHEEGKPVWCPLGHKANLVSVETNQATKEIKK